MNINNTAGADALDILFANRNTSYGAYQLRRDYNKRLSTAVLVMIIFCLLMSVLYNLQAAKRQTVVTTDLVSGVINLETTHPKEQPPAIQPPAMKSMYRKAENIATIKVTTPKIVADNQVKTPPATQNDMDGIKIDVVTTDGVISNVIEPPVNTGTGAVESLVKKETYGDEVFTVQQEARLPGGQDAWIKFLQRNLRSDVPTENGAPTGSYTVMISFLVDKTGAISEVKAENDPGYGTAAEAVRVIQRGPVWIPAVQNGRKVIYRQKQAITFVVAEQE